MKPKIMEERGTAAWVTEMRTTLSHFCTGPTGGRKSSQVHTTQTHKRFKRMLIYYDIDNTMHIFREIPFFGPQNDT